MTVLAQIYTELESIREEGMEKRERVLSSRQGAAIRLSGGLEVVNFCANNYLGLADHPEVIGAAHAALDRWGFGLASVRFICGTQEIHQQLENRVSRFLGRDDTVLFGSCFDANAGLFETLLDVEDVVISDALNHASIIDGIRLCHARRMRYANRDMAELEGCLKAASGARRIVIATDGVFSMDGCLAPLDQICALADTYGAMVMVDDSHAVGVVGPEGRGTPALYDVVDGVDIVTGTFGKALGGASGGYVSGPQAIIDLLRQRSRPYLFSNSLAPPVVVATLAAIDLVERGAGLRARLNENATRFRQAMIEAGFELLPGEHPIVPVMFGDAFLANETANRLLDEGIYAAPFSYPVVPRGAARIRVQVSAAHSEAEIDRAVDAFVASRAT